MVASTDDELAVLENGLKAAEGEIHWRYVHVTQIAIPSVLLKPLERLSV